MLLGDTFRNVRSFLDEHGAKDIPIHADLPVWYDQVGEPVGWQSEAERDAWFADLGRSLASITLMAYERNTAARIEDGVGWEYLHFKGNVRLGLEASVGPGHTWPSFADLMTMVQLEEHLVQSRDVDIHDFTQFHDLASGPPQPTPTK